MAEAKHAVEEVAFEENAASGEHAGLSGASCPTTPKLLGFSRKN